MPSDRTYRIKPASIEADLTALTALQWLSGYTPHNPAYSATTVAALGQALKQARENEIHAQNAMAAARDAIMAAEWALHEAMLGVKAQAIAQYGPDSDAIAALGLKKKSKRRRASSRS